MVCVNICRLLFGLKFLLGAEDRAHGCTREFLGHSDIAIRSYAPTFHLARIRVDEWGHSGWRYARKQIGIFAGMAYERLRGSGVRVMTYVDDVLQSDPFAPGLGATKVHF